MNKLECPECKRKWLESETIEIKLTICGVYLIPDFKVADMGFCPACFFMPEESGPNWTLGESKGKKVKLLKTPVKMQSVVNRDEFGNYWDQDVDTGELKPSVFGDFENDVDDHNSVWGGAGPDCSTVRREAATH